MIIMTMDTHHGATNKKRKCSGAALPSSSIAVSTNKLSVDEQNVLKSCSDDEKKKNIDEKLSVVTLMSKHDEKS